MKNLREYVINFGNLKLGKHEYEFDVDNRFFENFEYSIVKKAKLKVDLTLEKQRETLLTLYFKIKGTVGLDCDRCLDEFDLGIDSEHRLLVKLEANHDELDSEDDLIFLSPEAYMIDISPYIYEFINLSVPLSKTCDLAGKKCNERMIDYLAHVNDRNKEEEAIDPRWSGLKKIQK